MAVFKGLLAALTGATFGELTPDIPKSMAQLLTYDTALAQSATQYVDSFSGITFLGYTVRLPTQLSIARANLCLRTRTWM